MKILYFLIFIACILKGIKGDLNDEQQVCIFFRYVTVFNSTAVDQGFDNTTDKSRKNYTTLLRKNDGRNTTKHNETKFIVSILSEHENGNVTHRLCINVPKKSKKNESKNSLVNFFVQENDKNITENGKVNKTKHQKAHSKSGKTKVVVFGKTNTNKTSRKGHKPVLYATKFNNSGFQKVGKYNANNLTIFNDSISNVTYFPKTNVTNNDNSTNLYIKTSPITITTPTSKMYTTIKSTTTIKSRTKTNQNKPTIKVVPTINGYDETREYSSIITDPVPLLPRIKANKIKLRKSKKTKEIVTSDNRIQILQNLTKLQNEGIKYLRIANTNLRKLLSMAYEKIRILENMLREKICNGENSNDKKLSEACAKSKNRMRMKLKKEKEKNIEEGKEGEEKNDVIGLDSDKPVVVKVTSTRDFKLIFNGTKTPIIVRNKVKRKMRLNK